MSREFPRSALVAFAAIAALIAVVVLVVRRGGTLPDGPEPVAWNRAPCAHCHMLVGEPPHAAQLITGDGDVLDFDDPGCLLLYIAQERPLIHRMWFHHSTEDRWLADGEVAFADAAVTPMGYRLIAVDAGTPGALTLEDAKQQVLAIARSQP